MKHPLRMPLVLAYLGAAACLRATETHPADGPPALEVYVVPGCHDCGEFQERMGRDILRALAELGVRPEVRMIDVMEGSGYERLLAETSRLGWEYRGVPLLKAGDRFFYGDELSSPGLARSVADALAAAAPPGGASPEANSPATHGAKPSGAAKAGPLELDLWLVIGAGLVDGINPCALATLLFLISALALGGKERASVALIGLGFVIGVFVAYFAVGLGLLKAGAIVSTLPWLRTALWTLAGAGLWVLGALSLRDWRAIRQGRRDAIVLRLPDSAIRRIHALIRGGSALWLSGLGAAALGALVSLSEFVCTGQIYLPTLVYISRKGGWAAVGWLAAYNVAFVLPLVGVFALVVAGMSHARLTRAFQRNLAASKLILGAFFLAFGTIMLIGAFM